MSAPAPVLPEQAVVVRASLRLRVSTISWSWGHEMSIHMQYYITTRNRYNLTYRLEIGLHMPYYINHEMR
jgi:hypothetical protein